MNDMIGQSNEPKEIQKTDDVCQNCKYFWKTPQKDQFCRRGPPQVTNHIIGQHQLTKQPVSAPFSSFPPVRPEWTCGEFRRPVAITQ